MIPTRLHQWFFHPAVRMDRKAMYNGGRDTWLVGRRSLVMGGRAVFDSQPDLFNVVHEMGHLIEIDDARATAWNWGLVPGTWVEIPGIWAGHEPHTAQAVEREIRVLAIQAAIEEHVGRSFNYLHAANLLANGSLGSYFIFRNNVGCEYADEKPSHYHKKHSVGIAHQVVASVIRGHRDTLEIGPLWDEWCRKQEVVAAQLKAESEAALSRTA